MNKSIYLFALLFTASTLFISCGDNEVITIPVASVTLAGCNLDAPLAIGVTRRLIATVLPENATNRAVTWTSSDDDIATVTNDGLVTAVAAGTATIIVTTADGGRTATCVITAFIDPVAAPAGVVINGIRWATRNVDMPGRFAQHPESAGRFFQWGTLNGIVHHWATTGTVTGWDGSDNRVAWTSASDPCPQGWRVPTETELTNLQSQPNTWTQRNDVNGRLFGTAPNQIFLPASGWRHTGGALRNVGTYGYYWSSIPVGNTTARRFRISSGGSDVFIAAHRAVGFSVRCVAE